MAAKALRGLSRVLAWRRRHSLVALIGALVLISGCVWVAVMAASSPETGHPTRKASGQVAPSPSSQPPSPSPDVGRGSAGGANPQTTATASTPKPTVAPSSPGVLRPTPTAAVGSTAAPAATLSVHVSGNRLLDAAGRTLVLRGVNLSGTEFSCIQDVQPAGRGWGIYGGQPLDQPSTYSAIVSWHANVVRVPLNEDCWLGINGVNPAFGSDAYRKAIESEVTRIHQAGLYAVLDLHWSSPGSFAAYAQQPMPDADHSIAFWQSIGATFKSDPAVIFDLFNEPFFYYIAPGGPDQWTCWLRGCAMNQIVSGGQKGLDGSTTGYTTSYNWQTAGMQAMVDAVRGTGATQPILVNGADWGNDLSGWLANQPHDPAGQLIAGWHSYPEQGCSGHSCWDSVIRPITLKVPVLVGETGDNVCAAIGFDDTFLPWADSHGISYLGWTWNPWEDCKNVLIKDWTGTPTTNWGTYYRTHLAAVTGS